MKILGIHDGHNASVCLLNDGIIELAEQEERFTYEKNQGGMPLNAIQNILNKHPLKTIDRVVFVGSYMGQYCWSREDVLKSYSCSGTIKDIFKQKIKQSGLVFELYKRMVSSKRQKIINELFNTIDVDYIDHHLCHASAAYYGRGVYDKPILVITADGDGDGRSGTVHIGKGGKLYETLTIPASNSMGRLYSYITYLFNMVPYEHEYKIMGLAPYCTDRKRINQCKKRLSKIIGFKNQSDLAWKYLGKYPNIQSAGREINEIFRTTRFDVMAGAIQEYTEDVITEWVRRLVKSTGIKDVALAGGIFMNVKMNMLLARLPEIQSIYALPSCGDESNAIGAAYYVYSKNSGRHPVPLKSYYLGEDIQIDETILERTVSANTRIESIVDIEARIAELLAKGEIVGRVKGPMEFGARSLGNRAILANPSVDGVLRKINEMIKGRDFWMPFAPSVLAEDLERYFKIDEAVVDYEYMIFTADSNESIRDYAKNALHPYDSTGRPQAVHAYDNPDYYNLLKRFKELTGESLILNTSYNLHGYPMVKGMDQALHVFDNSDLRYLALGNYLLSKNSAV